MKNKEGARKNRASALFLTKGKKNTKEANNLALGRIGAGGICIMMPGIFIAMASFFIAMASFFIAMTSFFIAMARAFYLSFIGVK
jgi:hypothetical protein